MELLNGCIYDSRSPNEFEPRWSYMIANYDLGENQWLSNLYGPQALGSILFAHMFWAGMSMSKE